MVGQSLFKSMTLESMTLEEYQPMIAGRAVLEHPQAVDDSMERAVSRRMARVLDHAQLSSIGAAAPVELSGYAESRW